MSSNEAVPSNTNLFTFLSLGQAFGRTFSTFFDRLDIYLTISGAVHLPAIILTIVVVLALAPVSEQAEENHMNFIQEHIRSVLAILWLQVVVSSLVTIVGEGGMVRATADIYAGRNPEWYPSFRFGMTKFLPLMGASLLVMLAYAVLAVVTLIVASIFWLGVNTDLGFLFMLVALIVVTAGCCVGLYIWMTVIPLYSIIIIEEKGPIAALHRCMELSRGRRAYFFVGVFLLVIAQYVSSNFLHRMFHGGDPATFFFAPAGQIVSQLPHVLFVPLVTILGTVLYMSVRADKEGLNQQVLQRELSEPVEYNPPVSDYRRVALVDERQQPNIVTTASDDDAFA